MRAESALFGDMHVRQQLIIAPSLQPQVKCLFALACTQLSSLNYHVYVDTFWIY
jgi:hypothetical protein